MNVKQQSRVLAFILAIFMAFGTFAFTMPATQVTAKTKKVFWTKKGKKWHRIKKCRTLKRSKKIYKGTIKKAKKAGKKSKCKVCYK